MPTKTGYMDKERAESAQRHKMHLSWLGKARANFQKMQADSRKLHAAHQAAMNALAKESRQQHKAFIASNRKYARTLGKFDIYR